MNKYTVSHNSCICIVIYYKCIDVSASFGHHIYIYICIYIYINTKIARREDSFKHKTIMFAIILPPSDVCVWICSFTMVAKRGRNM
jgi:hypothetical protein